MTIIQTRLRDWLPQLLSGRPHKVIGGPDPYLLRWHVIPRNRLLNVYVHKFLRSDDDRALHDHPWWFVSLILRGRYDEVAGPPRRGPPRAPPPPPRRAERARPRGGPPPGAAAADSDADRRAAPGAVLA